MNRPYDAFGPRTPGDDRNEDPAAVIAELAADQRRAAVLARLNALRTQPAALHEFVTRVEAFVASPDDDAAEDIARGNYFTPGVTQAHGCLDALAHCAACNEAQS